MRATPRLWLMPCEPLNLSVRPLWGNWIMGLLRVALSIVLLTASGAAMGPRLEFRNFSSKGPEYKALENLRLAAPDIAYAGIEETDVFGKLYRASKYSLVPFVEVQTLCAIGAVNTEVYERVAANFEIHIVEDEDRSIHNEMARKMYDIWNRKEIYSGEYYYWFNAKDGAYALTALPDSVNVKGLYFIWIKNRLIKITFKGFVNKEQGGWGVVDGFTADNLRIWLAGAEFKAYKFPLKVEKKYLELYKKGFFNI
jgi:hypothetical protein